MDFYCLQSQYGDDDDDVVAVHYDRDFEIWSRARAIDLCEE